MLYGAPFGAHARQLGAGDHDHVAARPRPHRRQQQLGQAVGAERVRAHDAVELLGRRVGDRQPAAGDAGVVDQQVDVAPVIEHRPREGVDVLALRE